MPTKKAIQKHWAKTGKELGQIAEKDFTQATAVPAKEATSAIGGLGKAIIKRMRGIKHPDELVKNHELYGMSEGPRRMPNGNYYSGDWHDLYILPGRGGIKDDAKAVLGALESGVTDINSISVQTGLPQNRIEAALNYLNRNGYDVGFSEET